MGFSPIICTLCPPTPRPHHVHTLSMPRSQPAHTMLTLCPRHDHTMPTLCPHHAQTMPTTCPRYRPTPRPPGAAAGGACCRCKGARRACRTWASRHAPQPRRAWGACAGVAGGGAAGGAWRAVACARSAKGVGRAGRAQAACMRGREPVNGVVKVGLIRSKCGQRQPKAVIKHVANMLTVRTVSGSCKCQQVVL